MKFQHSIKLSLILMTLIILSCKNEPKPVEKAPKEMVVKEEDTLIIQVDTIQTDIVVESPKAETKTKEKPKSNFDATLWTEITKDAGFALDIRYATVNNFTKKQIYDCPKCYMRPEAAEKLKTIQTELKEKFGYGIKVFDCYRPGPYQQRLWDIVPNPDYVTPPHKGSMHSRGLAIDLTLVDKDGKELDMGTEFDFFGPEAHQGYPKHSDAVKRHRWILKSTMEKHGFGSIRTEWWHYSYKSKSYPLDNWVWECE